MAKFVNVALSVTTEPRQIFDTNNVEVGDILTIREYKGAINDDGSYSYSTPRNGIVMMISSTGFTLGMAYGDQQFSIDSLVEEKFFITGHAKHIEG